VFEVNKNPSTKDLHSFGWAMLAGFGVIGLILWLIPWLATWDTAGLAWAGTGRQVLAVVLWVLGVALLLISRTSAQIARPVYVAWMSAVLPIGIAVSTILLTLLFVLLLPIFSVIVRLGDPLRKNLSAEESYWEDYRHYEPTLERMKRPF